MNGWTIVARVFADLSVPKARARPQAALSGAGAGAVHFLHSISLWLSQLNLLAELS